MKIKLFTDALNSRFETLLRNIKSKSNSFYDSYLDLLEETIKYFLTENNIVFDESRTCGFIVKTDEVQDFFLNKLKLIIFIRFIGVLGIRICWVKMKRSRTLLNG